MSTQLVQGFKDRFESLKGEVHVVRDVREAAAKVLLICGEAGASCVAVAEMSAELLGPIEEGLRDAGIEVVGPRFESSTLPFSIDKAGVGVSEAQFAIAETGTMVEVAQNDANRLVSSMPRVHVCVVREGTFVEKLSDAAQGLRSAFREHEKDCVVSFISGPSRTGDIELKLTLGVHGPESAHAVVILDNEAGDGGDG